MTMIKEDLEDEIAGLKTRITNIEEEVNTANESISGYKNTIKEITRSYIFCLETGRMAFSQNKT